MPFVMDVPRGETVITWMIEGIYRARGKHRPISEIRLSPVAYRQLRKEVESWLTSYPVADPSAPAPDKFWGYPVRMDERQPHHVYVAFADEVSVKPTETDTPSA